MNIVKNVAIADIDLPSGGRKLRPDNVADLAASMDHHGQLSPIGVREVGGRLQLVYGRHRLAAAQQLGWLQINAQTIDADERMARMVEIAENLHRAELTVLERSEQRTEWLQLAEEGISAQVAQKFGPGRPEGGVAAAARELGIDRNALRRAQTIASLPASAKEAARRCSSTTTNRRC